MGVYLVSPLPSFLSVGFVRRKRDNKNNNPITITWGRSTKIVSERVEKTPLKISLYVFFKRHFIIPSGFHLMHYIFLLWGCQIWHFIMSKKEQRPKLICSVVLSCRRSACSECSRETDRTANRIKTHFYPISKEFIQRLIMKDAYQRTYWYQP